MAALRSACLRAVRRRQGVFGADVHDCLEAELEEVFIRGTARVGRFSEAVIASVCRGWSEPGEDPAATPGAVRGLPSSPGRSFLPALWVASSCPGPSPSISDLSFQTHLTGSTAYEDFLHPAFNMPCFFLHFCAVCVPLWQTVSTSFTTFGLRFCLPSLGSVEHPRRSGL